MFALTVFPETVLMSGDSWSRIKGWVPERSSKKEGHPLCYKCDPVETSVAAGNVCSREIQPEKTCNNRTARVQCLHCGQRVTFERAKFREKERENYPDLDRYFVPK